MKFLMVVCVAILMAMVVDIPSNTTFPKELTIGQAEASIKYISGYSRSDGTSVSGHYRDTSNDGNSWNNANTLGYND